MRRSDLSKLQSIARAASARWTLLASLPTDRRIRLDKCGRRRRQQLKIAGMDAALHEYNPAGTPAPCVPRVANHAQCTRCQCRDKTPAGLPVLPTSTWAGTR